MSTKIIQPYALGTEDTWLVYPVGSSKMTACDPGDPVSHNDATNYIQKATTGRQRFKPNTGFPEGMSSISDVTIYAAGYDQIGTSTVTFGVHYDGNNEYSSALTAPVNWAEISSSMAAPGGSWTEAVLRHSSFEWSIEVSAWVKITSLWLVVTYVPDVSETTFDREITSRLLRWSRLPIGIMSGKFRLDAIDIAPGDVFAMSHYQIPETTGNGAGRETWKRRHFRATSTSLNPNDLTVGLEGKDLRKYLANFWDTGVSPYTVQSDLALADGPARLDPGGTRTFTNTGAWIEEEGGLIVPITANKEKITPSGMLIENYRTNYIKNSSFGAGTFDANWVAVVGATITQKTDVHLFHTDLSAGVLRMQGDAGDGVAQNPTVAWESDLDGTISIDHQDVTGDAIHVYLSRNNDSKWYKFSNDTWETTGGPEYWAVPVSTTMTRDYRGLNMTGVGTATCVVQINCTAASQDVYLGHVQLEGYVYTVPSAYRHRFAQSRIYNAGTTAVTINSDVLGITSYTGRRCVNNAHGTAFVRYQPIFNRADITDAAPSPAEDVGILEYSQGGGSGDLYLFYSPENGQFEFQHHGLSTAVYAVDIVKDSIYNLAVRWTSDEGELGLANYSTDIFVNGVKGTGQTGGSLQTEIAAAQLRFGQPGSTNDHYANGYLSQIEITPLVLTDDEIKGLP